MLVRHDRFTQTICIINHSHTFCITKLVFKWQNYSMNPNSITGTTGIWHTSGLGNRHKRSDTALVYATGRCATCTVLRTKRDSRQTINQFQRQSRADHAVRRQIQSISYCRGRASPVSSHSIHQPLTHTPPRTHTRTHAAHAQTHAACSRCRGPCARVQYKVTPRCTDAAGPLHRQHSMAERKRATDRRHKS